MTSLKGRFWRVRSHVGPCHGARSTCMRLMFQAMVTKFHSPLALSSPRMRICRQPITRLMMPNTGSTVCLRSLQEARVRSSL